MRRLYLSILATAVLAFPIAGTAEPIHRITLDGDFADWAGVPSYTDPADDQHDTDHTGEFDVPAHVDHEDADLLEFKFTHDEENLYAYFRTRGLIGRTQSSSVGTAGRYYVIVTIDVDNDDATGYPLHEGGYYPSTPGYDMNMEVEFYDDAFNTGHYLNHGCLDNAEFLQAQAEQSNGWVNMKAGTYDWYTQWVWFDTPQGLPGEIILPTGEGIVWVTDRGPAYPGCIIEISISPDGHEAEVKTPFRGFMLDAPSGNPLMALGKTIDVSFSVEASSEFSAGGAWASDTADPIVGYELGTTESGVAMPMKAAPAALFLTLAAITLWMVRRGGGNISRSKEFTPGG